MRAHGEVRQALFNACRKLATPERGVTLREMAVHAQVGFDAARATVQNMHRSGQLRKLDERTVHYRSRPVVEYAPSDAQAAPTGPDLSVFRVWG